MRVLEKQEVTVVYGGLMMAADGDSGGSTGSTSTSSGSSTAFPNYCPPGYAGTTTMTQSTTTTGFSSSGTFGATGPLASASGTLNSPTTSKTTTYTQQCLPVSSGSSGSTSSSSSPSTSTSSSSDKPEDDEMSCKP